MRNIVLIACSASKQPYVCKAKDLYIGELFNLSRQWAEACGPAVQSWHILSAKYGLLHPEQTIQPYEETLDSAAKRREWSEATRSQIGAAFTALEPRRELTRFILLAGNNYCEWTYPPITWAATTRPLRGLGIGQQKAALGRMIASLETDRAAPKIDRASSSFFSFTERLERSLTRVQKENQ